MVTTKFIGRLGNSMFQTAAVIGYAKKYGYQWGVPNDQRESTILTHFPHLRRFDGPTSARYHEHPSKHCKQHNQHFDDCHFNYHDLPDLGSDLTLTGFFQSWKYFENAQEEVKDVFKLQINPAANGVISLHVRRGDYVQHSGSFPPIDENYIKSAFQRLVIMGVHVRNILVFSDDIEWCKENVPRVVNGQEGIVTFFYPNGNELEDISLMASCDHHVIANSSFSWWGAYLGHNPNKIVVSPSCVRGNWFGIEAGVKHDVVDLLPPDWIQIKFR